MRLLLDTHALLWVLEQNPRLSTREAEAIGDEANEIFVSATSILEITLKHRIGKLPDTARYVATMASLFDTLDATPLPISIPHAALAGGLDIPHKDPFDRLLIARAQAEGLVLVSNEAVFDGFGVERLW